MGVCACIGVHIVLHNSVHLNPATLLFSLMASPPSLLELGVVESVPPSSVPTGAMRAPLFATKRSSADGSLRRYGHAVGKVVHAVFHPLER